jgi:ribonuclease Y
MAVDTITVLVGFSSAIGGFWAAYAVARLRERALRAEFSSKTKDFEERLRRDSDALSLSHKLAAQEQLERERSELERSLASRRAALDLDDERISNREAAVTRQLDRLAQQEADLRQRSSQLDSYREQLELERTEIRKLSLEAKARLELTAELDSNSARTLLLREVERESAKDAADLSRHILEDARNRAEIDARRIVGIALQRYAATHTFETTTATVALTGDDMKGRIIGREGRNIRAFEAATGVTVLVDDTPNAVVLSGFDPVRREIARQAMERLILDGRIHPVRIEEVVAAVSAEMDTFIERTGEEAVMRASLPPVHIEVARMLGKLRFRHSYSQNVLEHSLEVAQLCGLMAAELGEDVTAAKRSGLLHDIGKAVSHEIEGPHALVGADLIKRYGETPDIVNAVASHHDEVPHENLLGILVSAADAISASRPGARSESMTTYLKRLEKLEQIALDFDGVEKAYAVQAGRELRVVVRPEAITDDAAHLLARQLARRIEEELLYPGQIRITVVRETRCVEFAK